MFSRRLFERKLDERLTGGKCENVGVEIKGIVDTMRGRDREKIRDGDRESVWNGGDETKKDV